MSILLILLQVLSVHAQTLTSGYGAPTTPLNVANGSATFKVKIIGSASACSGPSALTITMPTGYFYVSGSASVTAGTGTVSETSVSGGTAVLSVSSIPASPDSTVISYQAYAGCGVIGSSASNQVSYSLAGCVGTVTALSNVFNALNAKLNIINITNSAYTGTVGDIYTRAITMRNDGFGSIDTIYLDDVSGNGLAYQFGSVTTSVGTIASVTTLPGGLNRFKVKGVSLATGQSVTITETMKIVSCSNLNTNFDAWYGPNAVECTGVNSTGTAGANINGALQPNLSIVAKSVSQYTCMGTNIPESAYFINTGTALMKSVKINLVTAYGNGAPFSTYAYFASYQQAGIDTLSLNYTKGSAGAHTHVVTDSSTTWITPDASLVGKPANLYITLPDIAAGDTVVLYWNAYKPCVSNCITASEYDQYFTDQEVRYSFANSCGVLTSSTAPTILVGSTNTGHVYAKDVPGDVFIGHAYHAAYTFVQNQFPRPPFLAGTTITYTLQLPKGTRWTGNVSDYVVTQLSGAPLPTPASISYDSLIANKITVVYVTTVADPYYNLANAEIRFNNITSNCSGTIGTTNSFDFAISATQASCGCTTQYVCSSIPANIHCPFPCPRGGVIPTDAFAIRTNYGAPDNNNDGIADASGSIDMTKVKTNYVMNGDTLELHFANKILYGTSSPGWPATNTFKYGYIKNTFDNIPWTTDYTPAGASISVYNSAGVLRGTCASLPFTYNGATATGSVDFSAAGICGIGGGYTYFVDGDSLAINVLYKTVQHTQPGGYNGQQLINITNEWYVSDVISPTAAADKYYCDIAGGNFTMLGIYPASNGVQTISSTGCGEVIARMDDFTGVGLQGYAGVNNFVYEYRPTTLFDSLKFTLPTGWILDSMYATYVYTNGVGFTAQTAAKITPVSIGSTYVYAIKNNYAIYGGTWGISDEGSNILYQAYIHPSCSAASGTVYPVFYMTQRSATATALPYDSTYNIQDIVNYTKPNIILASGNANQTVTSSGVTWEVQMSNTTNYPASNVWLGKDAGISGVTITSVQLLTGTGGSVVSTLSPVGGVYQLGNFNTVMSNYYRITATYTSCVKDSINIAYGFDCTSYPSSVASALCKQDLKLTVVPQPAALQLTILSQPPTTPIDLCSSLDYEVQILNPALGDASTPLTVDVTLPATGGVVYKTGSYQLSVPSGSYVSISDANVTATSSTITFSIPAASLAALSSTQTYKLKFSLLTTACDFVSGQTLRFRPLGKNPCGQVITGTVQQSNKLTIIGTPTSTNSYTITSHADSVVACGGGAISTTYKFKIINQGPSSTSTIDGFDVDMPSPWQLNPASVVFSHNPSSAAYSSTVGSAYNFTSGSGLSVGDSIVFTATISVPASSSSSIACGPSDPIKENATVSFTSTCIISGTTCTSKSVVSNNEGTSVLVQRPVYAISSFTATASPGTFGHPFPGDSLQGTIALQHSNTTYTAQNVLMSFYNDVNSNGIYDAGDILIGSQTFAVANTSSQTFNYSVKSAITGTIFSVVAVANLGCGCSNPQASFSGIIVLPLFFTQANAQSTSCAVHLSWSYGNNTVAHYVIERSNNARIYNEVATLDAKATSYIDVTPESGSWYYRIKAINIDGTNTYSPTLTAQTTQCIGHTVNIYPNPAQDQLQIILQGTSNSNNYELVDALGRVVMKGSLKSNTNNQVEVSHVSQGVYVLRVIMDESVTTQQLHIRR